MSLLIRADGGPEIGAGHVMRCLALAQAYQDAQGRATFLMAAGAPILEERLQREGFDVSRLSSPPGTNADAAETDAVARSLNSSWIIVDGYHFGESYQKQIKNSGHNLACVDDDGRAGHYWADLVVNQNAYADESMYPSKEPHTTLLLGAKYALLRREFVLHAGWLRDPASFGNRLLVTLGGGDSGNATLTVVEGLSLVDKPMEVVVVVGPNDPRRDMVEQLARRMPLLSVETNVLDMCGLMRWADLAVSASGSTCWEIALMQLPALLIVMARNQEPVARKLCELGASGMLGAVSALTPGCVAAAVTELISDSAMRLTMQRACRELVDGRGSECVTRILMGRN